MALLFFVISNQQHSKGGVKPAQGGSFMNIFFGIILISVAIVSGFYLERQAFMRRNAAGIQEFSSYAESVKIRLKEGIIKAFGVVAGLVGIVLVVTALI